MLAPLLIFILLTMVLRKSKQKRTGKAADGGT